MHDSHNAPSSRTDAEDHVGEIQIRPAIPPDIQEFLGKRPLLPGEDPDAYDALMARIARDVKPTGMIEWIWSLNVGDLTWEILRWNRIKTDFLDTARQQALVIVLAQCLSKEGISIEIYDEAVTLAGACASGQPDAHQRADSLLRNKGLDTNSVMSQALSEKLDLLERIDRMIAMAESRREKVIREMETRRDSLARRLRQFSTEAIQVNEPT